MKMTSKRNQGFIADKWVRKLTPLLAACEAQILEHADEIADLQKRFRIFPSRFQTILYQQSLIYPTVKAPEDLRKPITTESLQDALDSIRFEINTRRKNSNVHACARSRGGPSGTTSVDFNELYLEEAEAALDRCPEATFTDLILHEVGHILSFRFGFGRGHDNGWRALGRIIGYVPVGSTSNAKRYAATLSTSRRLWNADLNDICAASFIAIAEYKTPDPWAFDDDAMFDDLPSRLVVVPAPVATPFVFTPSIAAAKKAISMKKEIHAAVVGPWKNVAALARDMMLRSEPVDAILAAVRFNFPLYGQGSKKTLKSLVISDMKCRLKKEGLLPEGAY